MIYALDTNIIISLLNNNERVIVNRDTAIESGARIIIPPIVNYEIRRGFLYKSSPKKEMMYLALVGHYGIGEMIAEMWERSAGIYAELRHKCFDIGDADIFIAAFCLVNDLTLVTQNIQHFKMIDELRFVDWTE